MTKREPFSKVEAHAIGGVIAYFNLIANGTIIDVYDYTCEKRAKQACDGINLAHTKAVAERVKEEVALAQYECGCAKCVNPPEGK